MNNVKMLPSLLAFAEVAKRQSFTEAAKQFGVSKSTISQQIKRLEEHIGLQLLSRHTRGMSLTSAGERLLVRCDLLQGQVNLAFDEITKSKEIPSGRFAITIPHSCEKEIVLPALNQLCIEFPELEPDILVTDQVMDLMDNNLDVAIHAGELQDSAYRALIIGTAREIFCASPAYVHKQGSINSVGDLIGHKLVAAPWQSTHLSIYARTNLSEKIVEKVSFFARTNTLPSALELVLHDMGVALLPEFSLKYLIAKGKLIQVMPGFQGRSWPFYLVHRFKGEKPIHITRFYQLVQYFFDKANAGL